MPNLCVLDNLIFEAPLTEILKGILLERSIYFEHLTHIHVFLQPLFIPSEHLRLNGGWRLGGGTRAWDLSDSKSVDDMITDLTANALPIFGRVRSVPDLIPALRSLDRPSDWVIAESIAYALARGGEREQAISALEEFVRSGFDLSIAWQNAAVHRAGRLRDALERNPARAQKLLQEWVTVTIANLGLQDFVRVNRSI